MLAATLSPTYGIYSGFELCENVPLTESSEEYLNSEKYEAKKRSLSGPLLPLIGRLNAVRRANPALQRIDNITFLETENDNLIAYIKRTRRQRRDRVRQPRSGRRRTRASSRSTPSSGCRRPSTSPTCSATAPSRGGPGATTCDSSRACSRPTCCTSSCDPARPTPLRGSIGGQRWFGSKSRAARGRARRRCRRAARTAASSPSSRPSSPTAASELYQLPAPRSARTASSSSRSPIRCSAGSLLGGAAARRAAADARGHGRVRAHRPAARRDLDGGARRRRRAVQQLDRVRRARDPQGLPPPRGRRERRARAAALPRRARLRAHAGSCSAGTATRARRSRRRSASCRRSCPDARDGWALALGVVRRPGAVPAAARRLGEVTARMHTALAAETGDPAFRPEALDARSARTGGRRGRSPTPGRCSAGSRPAARPRPCARAATRCSRACARCARGDGGRAIRQHGDYHLGQVLWADDDWQRARLRGRARAPARRAAPQELAAARRRGHAALVRLRRRDEPEPRRGRAADWESDGARGVPGRLRRRRSTRRSCPPTPAARAQLLAACELEKALYELRYELDNRPAWVHVPSRASGLRRLTPDGAD